jgi:hypothetical protein
VLKRSGLLADIPNTSVPQHDSGDNQIQAAGTVALIFKAPIVQLAEAIKEDDSVFRLELKNFFAGNLIS